MIMSSKIAKVGAVGPSDNREETSLAPGLYVNLFEVAFEDRDADLMCAERNQLPLVELWASHRLLVR